MISRYQDLYPMLIVHLPKCPEPLILQEIQRAGRRFCEDSEAWQEKLDLVDLVANQAVYTLTHRFEADIQRIVYVKIGVTGTAPTESTRDSNVNMYDLIMGSDGILNVLELKSSLIPTAAITDGMLVKVTLVPRAFCSELAPWFMERWCEGIVAAVLAKMKAMPKKTWSEPETVAFYESEYQRYKNRAIREVKHGFKTGNLTMQSPRIL